MERKELEDRVAALEAAGMSAAAERALLANLDKTEATKASAMAPATASNPEEAPTDFIPLNTESFMAGWKGRGWLAPATAGVKPGVCEGYMIPDFVDDQVWFIFTNPEYPEGAEPFRGALVCGALSADTGKSAAGKVKDTLDAMSVPYELNAGKGIKITVPPKGQLVDVFWEDVAIKGKTERRIQDVGAPGSLESAM